MHDPLAEVFDRSPAPSPSTQALEQRMEQQAVDMINQLSAPDVLPDPSGGQTADPQVEILGQLGQGIEMCLKHTETLAQSLATMQSTNEQYRQEFGNVNARIAKLEELVGSLQQLVMSKTHFTLPAGKPEPKPVQPPGTDSHVTAEQNYMRQTTQRSGDPQHPQLNIIDNPARIGGQHVV